MAVDVQPPGRRTSAAEAADERRAAEAADVQPPERRTTSRRDGGRPAPGLRTPAAGAADANRWSGGRQPPGLRTSAAVAADERRLVGRTNTAGTDAGTKELKPKHTHSHDRDFYRPDQVYVDYDLYVMTSQSRFCHIRRTR